MRSLDPVIAIETSLIPEDAPLAVHYDAALITIGVLDAPARETLVQRLSAAHQDTVLSSQARLIFASHGVPHIIAYSQHRQQDLWTSADIMAVVERVTRAMAAQVLHIHREAARFIAY
jgi:hypothetical protein